MGQASGNNTYLMTLIPTPRLVLEQPEPCMPQWYKTVVLAASQRRKRSVGDFEFKANLGNLDHPTPPPGAKTWKVRNRLASLALWCWPSLPEVLCSPQETKRRKRVGVCLFLLF